MIDPFLYHPKDLESPASFQKAIVPSDTKDLPVRPRVIFCAAAGTAVMRDSAGTNVTYTLEAGQILPFSPVRILATGTTATLIGWW